MIKVGFKSDKGLKRSNNEDACFVMPEERVFIVADGVGGNNAGEVASRTAVSKVAEYVKNHDMTNVVDEEDVRNYFLDCLTEVNQIIYDMDSDRENLQGRATTLVIAYIQDNIAYFVNIGDSRAYVLRNEKLSQITEDHTYVNTLIKQGTITKEEARIHPRRNMITRALGGESEIEPDFYKVEIKENDIVLLCSDGLYGELEDEKICKILVSNENMSDACWKLITKANRSGGRDNITVICVKV